MVSLSFKEIIARIKNSGLPEYDLVIGIGTGGVVPASLVAFHIGCDLRIMTFNYRDEKNIPVSDEPVLVNKPDNLVMNGKKIILVDDVSVSGKTMSMALKQLVGNDVKTLVLKGNADYVLFPDIADCIKWPWKE